jgi:hypothetical protein
VNLGDDADTTGAVYGQLAGAVFGIFGIPEEWQARLTLRETIVNYGARLFAMGQRRGSDCWWPTLSLEGLRMDAALRALP